MDKIISSVDKPISGSQTSNITNSVNTNLIDAILVGFIVTYAINLIYGGLENMSSSRIKCYLIRNNDLNFRNLV